MERDPFRTIRFGRQSDLEVSEVRLGLLEDREKVDC
jgi:hypothetical protein